MRVYITSYQLINFQSWDDSTKPIHLEKDIVNIIEGANETGKSVLYKVLYNFAFPGYWDPKELIRRGCSSGLLLLELSNGKIIMFQLEPKHHTYALVDSEGEQIWKDCPLPKEIIDELGLILDYDLRIILNVIDKDIALPFIKTSPKFNASLIKSRVEPPDITEFFQNVEETTKQLTDASNKFNARAREFKSAADAVPFTEIDILLAEKEKVDILLPVATHYSQLEASIEEIYQMIQNAPIEVMDPSIVSAHLDALAALQNISSELENYQKIISSPPKQVSPPESCKSLLDCYDEISSLTRCLDSCIAVVSAEPQAANCPNLDGELKVLSELKSMDSILAEVNTAMDGFESIDKKYVFLGEELERMRREIGVCPTCGRLLEANHV